MCVPKTSDHIQINIRMPNPSQEPPASSKAPNEDLKDMDVLCTFKIKIESQNLEYVCTKDQWPYQNQYQDAKPQSGTSSLLQSPKTGFKGKRCSLHLQIKIEHLNLEYRYIKDQWPYPNQDLDDKPQSGVSRPHQSSKSELHRHGCSLYLQNKDREPTFRTWVYKNQWPYPNQDQGAKPHSGTSSVLRIPKSGLKWHGFS